MLEINGNRLAPQLIILDKDCTLIAFDVMWRAWFDRFARFISGRYTLRLEARLGLAGTLGYDPVDGDWDPSGPLTLASTSEVLLLVAGQLYQYLNLPWEEALSLVRDAEEDARGVLLNPDVLRPIGDVSAWLQKLVRVGHQLALVTTDARSSTEHQLRALGLEEFFSIMVCGDDGLALKPAPDMALAVCQRLGIPPGEAIMVGDSTVDMLMARSAGLAAAIGVASGAMPADLLAVHADHLVPDIHAIHVLNGEPDGCAAEI